MAVTTDVLLYILLGAIAGIVYALRRVFILERKIDRPRPEFNSRFGRTITLVLAIGLVKFGKTHQ